MGFSKSISLTGIFCLAFAPGMCTGHVYTRFKYIPITESLASCSPRSQVLKSLTIQFFVSLSQFGCRLPGLALLCLPLPCVQVVSLSDLTLNLFGAQSWQEAMHFAWEFLDYLACWNSSKLLQTWVEAHGQAWGEPNRDVAANIWVSSGCPAGGDR